jgi:sugar lactone lactonase YvrE
MATAAQPPVHPPRLIQPVKAPATVPPPLEGPWAPVDTRLDRAELLPLPCGTGPEDVAIDLAGRLVAGGDDGCLWRWPAESLAAELAGAVRTGPRLLTRTGGRPLGIEVDPRDGTLIVCDASRGLLRVTDDGTVIELTGTVANTPILFCNNAAVARDGTVFFTDSSNRFPLRAWRRDILENRPNGRILAYHPDTRRTEVLADDLYFPNGVALTADESALLVVETAGHRLLRVPLGGGDPVELLDLPAYPDNMSAVDDGTFWIALPSPRLSTLERLMPHPNLRRVADMLPQAVQPQPKRHTMVAQVDGQGQVLRTLHGPGGAYRMLTGVRQHGAALYLGSLTEPAVARVPL